MRAVALMVLFLAAAAVATADPVVFVAPSHVMVQEGDTFELGIRVDAGTDTVTCFMVEFIFDADVIELESAAEGSLFSDCGYSTMFDWDDLGPGHHSCNDVTLGYWAYVVCPGELVHLELRAIQWGETDVVVTLVDLRDLAREPIPGIGTADGLVTVEPGTSAHETQAPMGQLRLCPNPFSDSVEISLVESTATSPVELQVHAPSGRLVANWTSSWMADGSTTWYGQGLDGSRLPNGVYFVTARGDGWERRGRLVLVR